VSPDLDGWLLVTDLDGTLWDATMKLHPGAREALDALTAIGVTVLAATARRPASAHGVMSANGLLLPAVLHDGALGRDFTTGETFHLVSFEPPTAAAVLEALQLRGLEPCVNVAHEERDVVLGMTPSTNPLHADFVAPWSRRGDLAIAVATEPVLSFTIVGRDRDLLLPAIDALKTIADASLSDDLIYGGWTLSVRPPGISKWSGALAFCELRGIDPNRTLAVGDGENDVEMLAAAAVSFTFEGASPGATISADHVLPPAGSGGWRALAKMAASRRG
jgi:hydroxymethylpyrimidine pyrophosphatase-like HAD family hydrolase